MADPDYVEHHMHSDCSSCPYHDSCLEKACIRETRHEIDAEVVHLHKFDKQYDEILKTAYEENPLPETTAKKRGRRKKSKVLNLICRLENYKASVCLFIRNPCVPFDNN